jgi:serine O-acetyltransferase
MIPEIRNIAVRLAQPDEHIPTIAMAAVDGNELRGMVHLFRSVVFDGYFNTDPLVENLTQLAVIVARQSARACRMLPGEDVEDADAFGSETASILLQKIPELRRRLGTDVLEVFNNDPAAKSLQEVILCYPAITAITHYRLAHELFLLHVPILPRLITEMAHSITGIDIHPGADIGDYFSIDHGTGVVIGETCIIGNHVRLYQGVTLGARSFKFDAEGNIINEPRHPILEDRVVVYSNSSILGRIRIGHDSVVGGNVWQTSDLPPFSRVLQGRATIVSTFEHGAGI